MESNALDRSLDKLGDSAFVDKRCGSEPVPSPELEPPLACFDAVVDATLPGDSTQDATGGATRTVADLTLPADSTLPPLSSTVLLPQIDGYEITGRLGEGGMGVVWKATQHGTHRPVAMKLMSAASFGSKRARQRFEREVDLTARLEHPHIARVYAGGECRGICFYAMELIDGVPLDQHVREAKFDRRQILDLMKTICEAVQYAHQRGVIHRDLKPANILVDREGKPRVLDFGLAKALNDDDVLLLSADTGTAGTPAYMSPEQAGGHLDQVDTRSDVYTLGVILFHLLSGKYPHDVRGSAQQVMKRISEQEPCRLKQIEPKADGDLEALLSKALAKEPQHRYGTAGEFAADLGRYLNGEPLVARPPTMKYLLTKRLRKHRVPLALAAGVGALLLGMAIWTYVRVTWEKNAALAANVEKEQQRQEAVKQRKQASDNEQRAVRGEVLAKENAATAQTNATLAQANAALAVKHETEAKQNERIARLRLAEGRVSEADALHRSGRILEAMRRYWEAFDDFQNLSVSPFRAEVGLCAAYGASAPPLLALEGHTGFVASVAISPDGRTALSGSWDKTLKLWDLQTGNVIRTLKGHLGSIMCVAISPDGRTALSGGAEKTLKLWNLETGTEILTLKSTDSVLSVAISPDGRTALSGSANIDKTLKLWDLETGNEIRTFEGHGERISGIAFSPDGRTALSGSMDATLKLWDLQTGKEIRTFKNPAHLHPVMCIAISPDGRTALSGGSEKLLKLWDIKTGKEILTLQGHADRVDSVAFSPDGHTALSASEDKTLKLWDLKTGNVIRTLGGHTAQVMSVAFSPDGRTALSGSKDNALKLWDLHAGKEIRNFAGHTEYGGFVFSVAFSPDGRTALSGSQDRTLKLWDRQTGKVIRTLTGHKDHVWTVAFSPDGRTALSGGDDKTMKLWDLETGREIRSFEGHSNRVLSVAFSPDGRYGLSGSMDTTLKLWDLQTGAVIHTLKGHKFYVNSVSFSPNGRTALSASSDRMLKLWDVQTGKVIRTLEGHSYYVNSVAFSPDGGTALSGSSDKTLKLWDLQTGKVIRTLEGHIDVVMSVAFSPDGRIALSGSHDGTLTLWDLQTGKEIFTLEGHADNVLGVAFSPDGRAALSGTQRPNKTLLLWDFARPARYRELEPIVQQARQTLSTKSDDSGALATLGQWYAFRGKNDWAVELLEKAQAGGATVDPLTLARCYWELSDDLDPKSTVTRDACLAAARLNFATALAAAKEPNDIFYHQLCLSAVERTVAAVAATKPATRSGK